MEVVHIQWDTQITSCSAMFYFSPNWWSENGAHREQEAGEPDRKENKKGESAGPRVLKGPENYNPNPMQPDTPAWIVCPNRARTRPPARLHCFPHTLVIVTLRSGVRSASAPPHEAGSQTYSSPHVNSDDSEYKQYIIYNLQEMCFIKKEARGPRPDPAHLHIF